MLSERPADPLENLIHRVETAVKEYEFSEAAALIERNTAEVWYGLPPARTREIVEQITAHGEKHGVQHLAGLRALFSVSDDAAATNAIAVQAASEGGLESLRVDMGAVVAMYHLRMSGRAHEALELLASTYQDGTDINTLFDPNGSTNLMAAVQLGVTAMLAGNYNLALTYFANAQIRPPIPTVPFLTRDAYVKAAMIHAIIGDPDDAIRALNRSHGLPRTNSWAERLVDANEIFVRALISSSEETAEDLLAVPLHELGETWPFYVIALNRTADHIGFRQDIEDELITMEKLPLPRVHGESLPGSIFQVSRCLRNLARGDVVAARRFVDEADPEDVFTQRCQLLVELASGRFRAAKRAAKELGSNPRAAGLRRVELWKLSGLAESHLALGARDKALEALRAMDSLAGGISVEDVRELGTRTRKFAGDPFPKWPTVGTTHLRHPGSGEEPVNLTDREFEILRLLNRDISRAEMARELFISVNTLKGHLRSIYRKLGVTNKDAAVIRASREGWL